MIINVYPQRWHDRPWPWVKAPVKFAKAGTSCISRVKADWAECEECGQGRLDPDEMRIAHGTHGRTRKKEKRLPLLLDSEFNFRAFPRVPWTKGFLMRHEELTYNILGACFEVYKRMGCGFLEAVYQECLEIELEYRDIPYVAQQELKLAYRDRELKQHYVPDFICYEKVIVEIKAVQEMGSDHQAQLLNYLHGTGMQVGLLANFGHYPKLEYKRMVL